MGKSLRAQAIEDLLAADSKMKDALLKIHCVKNKSIGRLSEATQKIVDSQLELDDAIFLIGK